jgi:hypothetical protein
LTAVPNLVEPGGAEDPALRLAIRPFVDAEVPAAGDGMRLFYRRYVRTMKGRGALSKNRVEMVEAMESIVSQQVYAAWVQTAGLVAAAVIAAAIYGLSSCRAVRRTRRQDRQLVERVLVCAQQARELFLKGELACSAAGTAAGARFFATLESERRCILDALYALPLEQSPDAALLTPVLKLTACLTEMGEEMADATPHDARRTFRWLHRRADKAVASIDALCKLHFEKPRFALKHKSEDGMPTTTVDRYAVFKFTEAFYLEPDGIDFEVLVNNQSVRCTISHKELDRLGHARHSGADVRRYVAIFKQRRELICLAAESLIRAGARSPVEVKYADVQAALPASPERALESFGAAI